jgi:antitoxin (DNA-binding transcriptional repressor) of toxin-antitoxin stability system
MKIVNMHEAKTNLSVLVKKALNGEKIVIAKHNNPIIELKPYQPGSKRTAGRWKGKIKILQDWKEADKEIEELVNNSKLFPDEKISD